MSREPPLNVAFALAEVVWVVAGRRDLAFLNFWNSKLPEFVGPGPDLHGAYGHRLRHHLGMDQLVRAYEALSHNPDTRQVVLQVWDSTVDLPTPDGKQVDQDIPCNVIAMPKVRDGKLEWLQIIRSNDLLLGAPHNFVQFTYLQEVMAGWLGIECGTYNQISDSLHLYERDEKSVLESAPLAQVAVNEDSLALPREESEMLFRELEHRIERLIATDLNQEELKRLVRWEFVPQAYRNMLAVFVAEAARRRGWTDMVAGTMSACTNPAFRQLWQRWLNRIDASNS
jgi:thymidylate synthase